MCFSETQSYVHTILLLLGSAYTKEHWRLSLPLAFLSIKDFLQGLLYRYQDDPEMLRNISTLSWIHLSLQPLFVNIMLSHGATEEGKRKFIPIFLACSMYAVLSMMSLKELDIHDLEICANGSNFCYPTGAYMGKYHIAYRFQLVSIARGIIFPVLYSLMMFVPGLFTNARPLLILWILFVLMIRAVFYNVRSGEQGAIWCGMSILLALPIAIYAKTYPKRFSGGIKRANSLVGL